MEQFIDIQLEAERLQQLEDPFRGSRRQKTGFARIKGVQGDTDGHRFAVADFVFGKLLELMRRPMAEIQRAGGAELERIARSDDMVQVQLSAAKNEPLHGGGLELAQKLRLALEG